MQGFRLALRTGCGPKTESGGGGPFETDPAFELSEKNPYLRSINIRYGYQEKQFGKKPAGYLPFQP